jgi:hypothetical protein
VEYLFRRPEEEDEDLPLMHVEETARWDLSNMDDRVSAAAEVTCMIEYLNQHGF